MASSDQQSSLNGNDCVRVAAEGNCGGETDVFSVLVRWGGGVVVELGFEAGGRTVSSSSDIGDEWPESDVSAGKQWEEVEVQGEDGRDSWFGSGKSGRPGMDVTQGCCDGVESKFYRK